MVQMKILLIAALSVVLTGCVYVPQAVVISPNVIVKNSQVGGDRVLSLSVLDERPHQTMGSRGFVGEGAALTIQGEFQTIVRNAIFDGLQKQSFRPQAELNPEGRELRVEIRTLDYALIQGFWALSLNIDVGLKAICVRGSMRPYEQLHRGHFTDSLQLSPTEAANTVYINRAVSDAVNSLLADQDLSKCLRQ